MLFSNLCLEPFTISAVDALLPPPPMRMIFSLIVTAAWLPLSWLKKGLMWKGDRILQFTSMLRSESIHLAHCAKRCKKSWCDSLRTRPAADRCQWQRGCGNVSLGRRIRGREGWGVTWCRKRRNGAGGWGWEHFDACDSKMSSSYNEPCNALFVKAHCDRVIGITELCSHFIRIHPRI